MLEELNDSLLYFHAILTWLSFFCLVKQPKLI
ncbi:MAG: hypothetical protein PWQ55_1975 [Chloroflexota bacterium]|nr:hypothetical protein [Chloroflexota bacterium]